MPIPLQFLTFLALIPPPPVAAQCGAVRDGVRFTSGIVRDDRLHITMASWPRTPVPNPVLGQAIIAALAGHALRACPIALGGRAPGLLTPVSGGASVFLLRLELERLLARAGLSPKGGTFRPHMTLGYKPAGPRAHHLPIHWQADRLVLIESWQGATRHDVLASWQLLPAAQMQFDFAA